MSILNYEENDDDNVFGMVMLLLRLLVEYRNFTGLLMPFIEQYHLTWKLEMSNAWSEHYNNLQYAHVPPSTGRYGIDMHKTQSFELMLVHGTGIVSI